MNPFLIFIVVIIVCVIFMHVEKKNRKPLAVNNKLNELMPDIPKDFLDIYMSANEEGVLAVDRLNERVVFVSNSETNLNPCQIQGFKGQVYSNEQKTAHLLVYEECQKLAIATLYSFGRNFPKIEEYNDYSDGNLVLFDMLSIPAFIIASDCYSKLLVGHLEPDEYIELNYQDILGFDIQINETTIISKSKAGAVVGGILGGTTGALIGSSISDMYFDKEIENVTLRIVINDKNEPLFSVDIFDWKVKGDPSYFYQLDLMKAVLERTFANINRKSK